MRTITVCVYNASGHSAAMLPTSANLTLTRKILSRITFLLHSTITFSLNIKQKMCECAMVLSSMKIKSLVSNHKGIVIRMVQADSSYSQGHIHQAFYFFFPTFQTEKSFLPFFIFFFCVKTTPTTKTEQSRFTIGHTFLFFQFSYIQGH